MNSKNANAIHHFIAQSIYSSFQMKKLYLRYIVIATDVCLIQIRVYNWQKNVKQIPN